MSLEDNIQTIRDFLLERYGNNLAAILIFGSANTGHFKEGQSDIDHIIFLKKLNGINIDEEIKFLLDSLKQYNFGTQYFNTLKGIKDYIKKRKSFSTYITIATEDGSRIVYTTPEFERTRKYLRKHPFTIKDIQEQIREKDEFELNGYFKNIEGFVLTKALMAHLRRKLQIINYFKTKKLIFDYERCLNNVDTSKEDKNNLIKLYQAYKERKSLSQKEIEQYRSLAEQFTERIIKK